jgi:hypothetical protein
MLTYENKKNRKLQRPLFRVIFGNLKSVLLDNQDEKKEGRTDSYCFLCW